MLASDLFVDDILILSDSGSFAFDILVGRDSFNLDNLVGTYFLYWIKSLMLLLTLWIAD